MTVIALSFLVEIFLINLNIVVLFRSHVMKENSKVQNQIIDNVLQQQSGNEIRKHPQEKTEERNHKKRPA